MATQFKQSSVRSGLSSPEEIAEYIMSLYPENITEDILRRHLRSGHSMQKSVLIIFMRRNRPDLVRLMLSSFANLRNDNTLLQNALSAGLNDLQTIRSLPISQTMARQHLITASNKCSVQVLQYILKAAGDIDREVACKILKKFLSRFEVSFIFNEEVFNSLWEKCGDVSLLKPSCKIPMKYILLDIASFTSFNI